ncbi:serpentine type 7TM GPCR chemoreceptor srt domain-containing protein [Ditylenchus destructor]|uniref:Serpentine type 7TM GPCR chemoreceptor srt domain-containing protein n=1 Tax=Ditylenchus destructor TaxID=166010 RepID=A0AAD4MZA7_9BILA|nr:serpentine type 7TM GPCR chemoreceptor srt domain-containing protein [Ditylenchus destructor]
MELYLFRPYQWEKLYSCSNFNISEVSFAERYHPVNGVMIIAMFVVFEVLYIPCMYSIYRQARNSSCYKLLFYVGIADVLMMFFHGLETGIYCFTGEVFCSNPHFNYITGCCGAALFAMETSANFFLAIDRCADCFSPSISKFFFSNNRTWIWTGFSTIFAVYYFFFLMPATYNGVYMNWFLNPYHGYNVKIDFSQYANLISTVYDMFLSFGFPAAYLMFVTLFVYKVKLVRSLGSGAHRKRQIMMFIQVAIINGLNISCFLLYTIMQHLPLSKTLIVIGYYINYFMFGFPPIIYLIFNTTIRRDCRKKFKDIVYNIAVRLLKMSDNRTTSLDLQQTTTFVESKQSSRVLDRS